MIRKTVKIKDLGTIITGTTPPTKNQEYYGQEYNFIKPTYIDLDNRFFGESEVKLSQEAYEKYSNTFIPPYSTSVVTIGSIGEKICMNREVSLTNQQINSVIPNKEEYDNMFVFYLLKHNLYKVKAANGGSSSGRENVNKTTFSSIEVEVPDLITQMKIGKILSSYDDLIENNIRRIKLLEESAELIYKEWFVNLRFPGYEKCNLVEGIPVGWIKISVNNILAKHKRKTKVKKELYLEKGDTPVIDQSRSFIGGYTNDEDAVEENIPAIIFGDHTRIVKYIDFKFASGADGTQLIYSNSENISQEYLYFAIKNIDLSDYAYARHFKYLKEEKIYIPSEKIMKQFTKISKDILTQVSILRNQNEKLKEARDILIPRLISGEIEV